MLSYSYVAKNRANGARVKGKVDAENEQAAAKLISKEGLVPIDIKEVGGGKGVLSIFKRVSTKDRILFTRQLATLLTAGLPLVQALRNTITQGISPRIKTVIEKLIADVEAGSTLSKAMSQYPQVFNEIYVNLVAAGETSGTLDKSLERLANQQEKDAEIISKVRGALIYPIIVLAVMGGVITFLMVKILPAVESLYASLPGVQLPIITRVMVEAVHLLKRNWKFFVVGLIVLVVFLSRWTRTLGGKRVVDKIKMKAWPMGPLMMKIYMARFTRTAHTLASSGVPIIQNLEITANAVNNVYVADSIREAIEKVKAGKSLASSLENSHNFLPLVPNMIRIGEESGTIDQMLDRVAIYYEQEVDEEVKNIAALMEPVLMIVLGVFALITVAAVLLPVYSLAGNPALNSAF